MGAGGRLALAVDINTLHAAIAKADSVFAARARGHRVACDQLKATYEQRDYALLWSHLRVPTPQALAVLQTLRTADAYGLRPADYDGDEIARRFQALASNPNATEAEWAEVDAVLACTALSFVSHLHAGRVDPRLAGFDLAAMVTPAVHADLLEALATHPDPSAVLAAFEPQFVHYRLLKEALAHYRVLAEDPSLTTLPPRPPATLSQGQIYAGMPALRRLLLALGDLPASSVVPADLTLDTETVTALKRFQSLHALDTDGRLGKNTFAALTVPLAQRVRQIELTLERWRWLPRLDAGTIIVNIPQFRLFALRSFNDHEADMLRMNVIVGKEYPHTQTPVFAADLKHVIFRPYWNVPYSILLRELLPELRKNPRHLIAQHFEIVRGGGDDATPVAITAENLNALAAGTLRLRQRPGAGNALGLIMFMLPNPYNVYLHSTPTPQLFQHARRTFSHGCIRVSDPVALAEHVLRETPEAWTAEKIRSAMDGKSTLKVPLSKPVHVLILYGTAVATEDGAVRFFEDIYGYDRQLEGLLGAK